MYVENSLFPAEFTLHAARLRMTDDRCFFHDSCARIYRVPKNDWEQMCLRKMTSGLFSVQGSAKIDGN